LRWREVVIMVIRAFMFLTNKTLMNEIETKFEKSTLMLQWGVL
jgi:hypothetical protein